jgi:iron(III) transport system substrate-binding protein
MWVVLLLVVWACTGTDREAVVVYTSLDQIFSEPILQEFERQTGIDVKAVYDVEASKTVGLVNRIIAEAKHPKCDVFWNSEVGRTLQLKKAGLLSVYRSPSGTDIPDRFKDKDGMWNGFAARARVLIYNTDMLTAEQLPKSIFDLTDPKWKAKVALGYPLLGTIATHMAALYALIGQQQTENFLEGLKKNQVVIVDGNSVVRDIVVQGEVPIGFTDTDDVNVAIQNGEPVNLIFPDQDGIGTLLIPNTVALIRGAPNNANGKKLIDYLLSHEVERKLALSRSAQLPVRQKIPGPVHMPMFSEIIAMAVDYEEIAEQIPRSDTFSRNLFIR